MQALQEMTPHHLSSPLLLPLKARAEGPVAQDPADQQSPTSLPFSPAERDLVGIYQPNEEPRTWISLSEMKHWSLPVDLVNASIYSLYQAWLC